MNPELPIENPHQLRRMKMSELATLAKRIREKIIQTVRANGGHLSSNLGITELTIALHYVFDFARDRLFFDVGHQCYAHKLLTGRGGKFDTLRQAGGVSGFPSPAESPYDVFYTGHAGTAISTAAGLAMADKITGANRKIVAVVGDASIVNGLAFEGLNNAALLDRQFLIILNDNSMAIDKTTGALARSLERLRLDSRYIHLRETTEKIVKRLPMGEEITDALRHIREGLRTTLHGNKAFEALGFNYFGPFDGHNIPTLTRILGHVSELDHPTVLHIHTVKGQGCEYAVEDPTLFHSPSAHTIENGKAVFDQSKRKTWTSVFAESLIDTAWKNDKVVAITAAMPDGTGLAQFREKFPERAIDVGISESHAVASAAGMAVGGLRPVVAVYSTFMQRAFDQVFHECSLQNLPVVFCMDRAGCVGQDGAVHQGFCDIAMLRPLPGIILAAPAWEKEMALVLNYALDQDGPVAIRYPRDMVPALPAKEMEIPPFQTGISHVIRQGKDGTLFAYGSMTAIALKAADRLSKDNLDFAVINARFAKPLDTKEVSKRLKASKPFLTIEDHSVTGGLGSAVLEFAASEGIGTSNIQIIGMPDKFIPHSTRKHQMKIAGLDAETIARTAIKMCGVSEQKTRNRP